MSHEARRQELAESSAGAHASAAFITDCHRNAVATLDSAFVNGKSLAVLIGEGKCGAAFVIGKFLARLKEEVAVARITEPSSTAIEIMRGIVSSIGFDPKALGLSDLEQIFKMFLVFQQTHNRRTIICVEDTQDNGQWVLDRIRRLVELEEKEKYGLMVIICGSKALHELLEAPPLNAIASNCVRRINLAPFSQAETREYIRRRVEGNGAKDIGQAFTFDAIMAIHELSAGVPDEVTGLCTKCLELADLDDSGPVTTAMVNRAAKLLRLASAVAETKSVPREAALAAETPSQGRLIAYVDDMFAHEQVLNGGHVLIGRDDLCDIRLHHRIVSRHHALIVNSSIGIKIVDLGSRNGTYVNGTRVRKHTLQANDRITIGNCNIEFVAGDDHHAWYFDTDPTDVLEPDVARRSLADLGQGFEMESIDNTETLISPRHFGASN